MRGLDPEVVDPVWAAVEGLLPARPADTHPLGCHRRRVSDRVCFETILTRLVTGCAWVDAERLGGNQVSDTTVRARRDEWITAGVFDALFAEALAAYDRIVSLDLSECAVDGSLHKAPCGGEGTGKNPTDRGKLGWKWSMFTDRNGIPVGWAIDGANRVDSMLFGPTLDAVAARGLLADIGTVHLDRGYDGAPTRAVCADHGLDDVVCAKKRRSTASPPTRSLRPKPCPSGCAGRSSARTAGSRTSVR
jgi:transposase